MIEIGVTAYAVAAMAFLFLTVLAVRRRPPEGWLIFAGASSTAWAAVLAAHLSTAITVPDVVLEALELLRSVSWFAFLLAMLGSPVADERNGIAVVRVMKIVAVALPATLLIAILVFVSAPGVPGGEYASDMLKVGHLLLSVFGLVLVEQLFRNADVETRWSIKFLCFGIGGLFAFDFYLFADALLLKQMDPDIWIARGIVNALVVPLIAISASRDSLWSGGLVVSRHVVFHSTALLAAGAYLMLMAAAGYYIRAYGGQWGGVLQAAFFFGAVVTMLIFALSGKARARLKVFVGKHFFRSKYDYRKEWLHFTGILTQTEQQEDFRLRILRAIAESVECTIGVMWTKSVDGAYFAPTVVWNTAIPTDARVSLDRPLVRFLEQRQWVIDLKQYAEGPERYDDLELPAWLKQLPQSRMILPLLHHDELEAFIVLGQPRVNVELNWEDHDLLKTLGRQAAGYLRLIATSEALTEARQFEAFNRLSAFVVHDLKNVVAQLSLVVTNSRKHINDPDFMADAVHTVENSVNKMNRMLTQLSKDRTETGTGEVIDLASVVNEVVTQRSFVDPVPTVHNADSTAAAVVADPDRLTAVIGHIVQNAQEATSNEGSVAVRTYVDNEWSVVEVTDTGRGMDQEFIRTRLFRPFDTTKGNAGMGVGVYESREFALAHGGEVDVVSQPEKGTTFRVKLPRYPAAAEGETPMRAAR